jgi:chromate transport protein ChrA
MVSDALLYTLASGSGVLGLVAAIVWVWFTHKVSDDNVRQIFLLYTLTTIALFTSEILFILRKNLGLADTWEYAQYAIIITGFISFAYATKIQLKVSNSFGFGGRMQAIAEMNASKPQPAEKPLQKKGARQRQKGL